MNISKRDIIIGTVTGILGNILYAVILLIIGVLTADDNTKHIGNILTFPIPLWYVLLINIFIWTGLAYIVHRRSQRPPEFLKTTSRRCEELEFRWVWKKNADGKYTMDDFWPICLQCGKQLRIEMYDPFNAYHCLNGHTYNFERAISLKRELLHHLKQEFSEYSDIIEYPDL